LNALQTDLGLVEYTKPFQTKTQLDIFCVTAALMMGTAGLPHVITRFYTVPSVRAARYSAGWALLFIALLYTTAPAIATFAKFNLLNTLNGKTLAEVETLDWANKWTETGLLKFEDKNGDGILTFTGVADTTEIVIDRDIIVLSTPEVAQLAPWVIALVAAGGLAAALSTASGLLLAMSSAVSHDIYFRILNPNASEGNRLMVGRGMIFLA
ncbi:MAG: cation acetate symporter, partial [Saprospiraceae bacterium]|nr:cation acetate symporter [Saprospiraceae bacterium]